MIPDNLADRDQWICWRVECRECGERLSPTTKWCPKCGEKETKKPIQPGVGGYASSTDPDTWTSLDTARDYHQQEGTDTDGIGFVFDPDGLIAGVDLDDCRDPDTGEIAEWARDVVGRLDSFTEVSPSGTGLHVYLLGFVPDGGNRATVKDGEIEVYDSGRYFTVTGDHVEGAPESVKQRNDALSELHSEHIAGDDTAESDETPDTVADADGTIEFHNEHGTSLEEIRDRDEKLDSLLSNLNPGGYGGDTSRADLATASKLYFWRFDEEQISRIIRTFRAREKVRERDDYLRMTIDKAWGGERCDPPAHTDGGATATTTENDTAEPQQGQSDTPGGWKDVRPQYKAAERGEMPKNEARFYAAEQLLSEVPFANREEDDTLYAYDPDTGVYNDNGGSVVRKRARKGLGSAFARSEVGELAEHVRAARTYTADELGGPEWHVAVDNGVLRVDPDGATELLDHSPNYMFLSKAGTRYDPDAECPRWREFLGEVVNQGHQRKKLQEYAGYCLMHWELRFHKALFIVGPQNSGKSTFADTIRKLLGGEENVASLSPQEMTKRFGTAELFGAWANVRNDIPHDTIEKVGTFKEIVAGDPIKAERKGKDLFMFKPRAKHIFAGNTLPDAEVDDGAFYRRILLVPFPKTVPRSQRDKQLPKQLEKELPGILNWALDGLTRLLDQSGFTGDLTPHETAETWEKWANTIDRFAKVCINTSNDATPKPKGDVYALYQRFCEAENFPAEPQQKMTRRLKTDHGVRDGRVTVDGRQTRSFLNIELTAKGESYQEDTEDGSGDATGLSGY